jgi:hypothetical protein
MASKAEKNARRSSGVSGVFTKVHPATGKIAAKTRIKLPLVGGAYNIFLRNFRT